MKLKWLLCLFVVSAGLFSFRSLEHRFFHRRFITGGLSGTPYIVIDKSDYELQIFDDEGWYATYPVVFGSKDLNDKMVEGDRRTPEGSFVIVSKRPHEKWDKMLLLNYPTPTDIEKFNERKSRGLIPANAKIGGGIGIHGTWPRDEMVVDQYQNWTNGCISMKRDQVDEIYSFIPVGTRVTIKR